MTLSRKITVEFIGTFFLMFTVGMAVATAGNLAPLAIGGVLMVMVFAGGHISGGHYNPAVSTAVLVRGRMALREYVPYVVTQTVGAIVAGLLIRGLGYAPHDAAAVAGAGKMLVVEFLFTFALGWVVLNVATAKGTESNSFYGLAIGSTVAIGIFAAGSVSGGAFNPAVALGGSVLGLFTWSHIWIYLLAELVGGAVAAGAFLLTQPSEKPDGQLPAVQLDGEIGRRAGEGAPRGVTHTAP
ncbi:MAG: aquaporin [Miltoncostaeaceae bacterium]|nr:aquaporin [Miltoncostaeaceae bacterium]